MALPPKEGGTDRERDGDDGAAARAHDQRARAAAGLGAEIRELSVRAHEFSEERRLTPLCAPLRDRSRRRFDSQSPPSTSGGRRRLFRLLSALGPRPNLDATARAALILCVSTAAAERSILRAHAACLRTACLRLRTDDFEMNQRHLVGGVAADVRPKPLAHNEVDVGRDELGGAARQRLGAGSSHRVPCEQLDEVPIATMPLLRQ